MKTIHENKVMINPPDNSKLEEIQKKMKRLLEQGRNDEKINAQYRALINKQ